MSDEAKKTAPEKKAPAKAKPEGTAPTKPTDAAPKAAAPAKTDATAAAPTAAATTEAPKAEAGQPTAQDLLNAGLMMGEMKVRKAKGSKNISSGVAHVLATFNNTKVTFTDRTGNVISWSSSGKCQFRGSRKSTAYAATVVTQDAGRQAMAHGMREVEVHVSGPGLGRDSAIRAVQALGFVVLNIQDVTPVPHNGCRPRKRRRV